ncbi:hypothetical protein T265_06733 [Opisthorchis viverrini]|uniref:Endonuclease/exonuclease/phosphatase domain-containing protein n=1 Tax=Opisthorchis viverrini TaxID=6198 RepID=A0A074ZRF2_OPIVI|nr:hypothetical protein T265_06733 [Opisthorchis viverrini]KER25930.1 hypothetical protein T265_06733 [Opisthorchis viverrini]
MLPRNNIRADAVPMLVKEPENFRLTTQAQIRLFRYPQDHASTLTTQSLYAITWLRQPGSIPALVLPLGSMAATHRKGATADRLVPSPLARLCAKLLTGRPLVRTQPLHLDRSCLGLDNRISPRPPCFLRVAWLLDIKRVCANTTSVATVSTVIELTAPSVSTRSRLRASGDPVAAAVGCAGGGIVLSHQAEVSLLEWIPVDSRLCAVRLATFVKESHKRQVDRYLFIVSAHAPTDRSSDAVKDKFYDALNALPRPAKSSDIVVAGDMNAQAGKLSESETQLGGRHGLDSVRTDNGERLLQLYADRMLFLCSTNFRNSRSCLATWCPPAAGRPQTQIYHIAISYR